MALVPALSLFGARGEFSHACTGRWAAGTFNTLIRGVPETFAAFSQPRSFAAPSSPCHAGRQRAPPALGYSGTLLYQRLALPRAFTVALPAYTDEVVSLLQETSQVSIIRLLNLTGVARIMVARSFELHKLYIVAGLMYLTMSYFFILFSSLKEHRSPGHMSEPPDEHPLDALRPSAVPPQRVKSQHWEFAFVSPLDIMA